MIRAFSFLRVAGCSLAGVLWAAATLAASLQAAPRDLGMPLIQTFGVRDYHERAQNWAITQDADGLLYVGNNNGVVLTYDGHEWRSIRVAEPGGSVRGLEFDAAGKLWIGATGGVGYLEKDGRGGFIYTSLLDRLPVEVRDALVMYHLAVQPDGVFFFTRDHVLRWDGKKFDVEKVRRVWALPAGNRLLRHNEQRPLEEWRDGAWRTLSEAPELGRSPVRFAMPQPDGSLLLATALGGFFVLKAGVLSPWPTESDTFFKSAGIERGLRLRDGRILLSHRPQGFSLLEADGKLRHYFTEQTCPLPTSVAWAFFEDRQDNLWVALDAGIAQIGRDDGLTYFGEASGARRFGANAICPFRGQIYLGTTKGLWRVEPAAPDANPPRPARLAAVPGVEGDIRALYNSPNELLVATPQGLAAWSGDGASLRPIVTGKHIARLWLSRRDPAYGLAGAIDGVYRLERGADGWRMGAKLTEIDTESRAFSADADGSLWISTVTRGYYRLLGLPGTASAEGTALRVEHYPGGNGLPSERVGTAPNLMTVAGRTRFLEEGRLFHFDAASRRFVEDYTVDARVGVLGAEILSVQSDQIEHLWATIRRTDAMAWPARGRQFLRVENDGAVWALPHRAADYAAGGLVLQVIAEPNGREVLWLAGNEGLVRAEPARLRQPSKPFGVRISAVSAGAGQPLPLGTAANLAFDRRSLSIRAATDRFGDPFIRYQTRLDDEPWSEWGEQPVHAFERLSIGQHGIQVRARDADGIVSAPMVFQVAIRPPWWLAWWSVAFYTVVAAGGIFGLVRWRVHALRRRNEELEQLVAARTTALRASEDELKTALHAAEGANRAKSVFLASMSHELRTPLNAILGYAQLLRHAPGLTAESRRQLETVRSSGDHLLHMINDVLDLAKIEAGKVELHVQPMSLSRLLAHLTELFEPRAAQKKIAFALIGETALPDMILADEGRLRQVLYNLLGNAIKFTERGRVELRVAANGERVRFTVIDTGVGIARAEQAAIFGLFHQAAGVALSAQGAGLGLAISQRLVRLMSSEISVESELGRGSRFSFELALPLASVALPVARAETLPLGYRGPRRRVLIVDDEPVNRDVLRALLEPRGFTLEETDNGEDAIARVERDAPDLVLMDLRLKQLDGLAATRRIRALPQGGRVRIIAISASVFPVDRTQAVEAGCDDFEPKPIRTLELLQSIGRLLALEWEWPQGQNTHSRSPMLPAQLPEGWILPSLAVLNELDAHADLGDMAALKAALARTRVSDSAAADYLDALETLAGQAQLAPLRDWIVRALQHRNASRS